MTDFKVGTILAHEGSYNIEDFDREGKVSIHTSFAPHFHFYEICGVEDTHYVCKRIYGEVKEHIQAMNCEIEIAKSSIVPCVRLNEYCYADKGKVTFSKGDEHLSIYHPTNVYTAFRYSGDDDWCVSLL
jgi:uncharacterized protein YdhG (YjbR/CyaY superfamily)